MSRAVLDDHLLRDLLADNQSSELGRLLTVHDPATTGFYVLRLCRSVVRSAGGALTGSWPDDARRRLGQQLLTLPGGIAVVPMHALAYRMAELAEGHRLSNLGAEAVASAERLTAPLCVWEGDDGPHIRSAAAALGLEYLTIAR